MKKISIACDHGGLELKEAIKSHYKDVYDFVDVGTYSLDSCDYPLFAFAACEKVFKKEVELAIVICKSGIGMSIAANKVKGVRCALLHNETNARLAHQHNNANAVALGANDVDINLAIKIIDAYFDVEFETRHQRRIDLVSEYENR